MSTRFRADLAGIPEQLEAPLSRTGDVLPDRGRLLIGGMGGSAAAGDFFNLYVNGGREVIVLREAALPADVRNKDVLAVVSYSGETEESLSLWDEARSRDMARGAIASGGSLLRAARGETCPYVLLPEGLAPRNALGYLLAALRMLVMPSVHEAWPETAVHLRSVRDLIGSGQGGVPEVLERLEDASLPVLLAGDTYALCAARRWQASLAENAKVPAAVWELPEAAHNRIVTAGRDAPRRGTLGLFALGTPRDEAARKRWDAVLAVLDAHGSTVLRVSVPHRSPWIEALGLAYLGDWMSCELADRLGVDPEPLALMTDVKSRLRHRKDIAS